VPTILCVDDDRSLCQILAKTFALEGWDVRVAHDGEQALREATSSPVDLMLLDLLLPKRDGFSVLEALRSSPKPLSDLPVILMSGCSRTPQYVDRAERLRAGAFLTKPVPLDDLLRVTAEQLGAAAPSPARTAATRHRRLAGALTELSFPALLHHLHGLRATGVLHLTLGKRRKAILLREGYPVAVKSNLVNECLGNLLVRSQRISQSDLEESLRRVREGWGMQGEMLVGMQVLSEEDLIAALREQAEEKLFEIFEWRGGEYRFEIGARLEGANALSGGRSPANVILDGVRRRMPLDLVDAALAANADAFLAPNESPFYRFQDIDLDPGENFLLRALDGTIRLRDLGEQGESVRRTLCGLLATEMLEPRIDASRTESPHAARAAVSAAAPAPRPPDPKEEELRAELTAMAERLRGKSYFQVLGVPESAGDEDVRRAYVELAKRTHPDRYSGASDGVRRLAEEIFGLVSKAHEQLSDAKRRIEYLLERRKGERVAAELEEGQKALQAELQFQQGEVKLKRKDWKGAIESFQWAVKLYPEEGEYHAHLGWARYLADPSDTQNVEIALELVKKGAKLAPDREKPYLFLGRIFGSVGRAELAEKMFTRAVQVRSDCVEALRELRLIHMRREKERGLIGRLLRR
jgi:CheY-like chemotaxis protein/DnaJ-domain-containing protein 1